ncbi:hypothetical protein EI94DRAFT_1700781 [Lactarius quietus]|nr:hypothetical protein EI94DRAFT_1700781 [Lactarius quietus]
MTAIDADCRSGHAFCFFVFCAFTFVSRSLSTGIPRRSTEYYPQQDFQAFFSLYADLWAAETEYVSDNAHAFASSSQESACSVEPGSAQDVSLILQILGKSRTPFGVKGGDFLARFDTFEVNSEAQTVDLGPSLLWDDVYDRWIRYSFRSNEFGLAIDNIVALELVLPNGTITTVTEDDHDLWFAIRVLRLEAKLPQGIVTNSHSSRISKAKYGYPPIILWCQGGDISYGSDQLETVIIAITEFSKVTDTNATLLPNFLYSSGEVIPGVILFYNAPQPPSGIFDTFLQLPSQQKNIQTRSYADIVNLQATLSPSPVGVRHTKALSRTGRGHFCGFRTTNYSVEFLKAIADQVEYWGSKLTPLDPDFTAQAFENRLKVAYDTMTRAIREAGDNLRAAALKDGQDIEHAAVYPNYALFDTPLEDMYGRMCHGCRIAAGHRSEDVMGLAGGFKFEGLFKLLSCLSRTPIFVASGKGQRRRGNSSNAEEALAVDKSIYIRYDTTTRRLELAASRPGRVDHYP